MIINAYHGTKSLFHKFACPAYFTDNYETAEFFTNRADDKYDARVLYCALELRNPFIVDLNGQSWGGFFLDDELLQNGCIKYIAAGDMEGEDYFKENGLTINFLAEYAEYLGYDGLVAYNCLEENDTCSTQTVVFDANSVKRIKVVKRNEST